MAKRGLTLAACVAALALLPGALTPSVVAAGPATECENAGAGPSDAAPGEFRRAIKCLIAERRAAAERKALRTNRALRGVARRHNERMLAQDCFSHQCQGEAKVATRIERSAYVGPGDRYGFGENLGYGPTPQAMVDSWMSSTFHRKNILGKRFRHIGVAAGRGAPVSGQDDRQFVTYTIVLAWRRR